MTLAKVGLVSGFFRLLTVCLSETLDTSPAPEFTPIRSGAESTGTRKAGKKGPKKAKLQVALTRPELRRLRRWILENSIRTGERNLAAPEIVDHIKEAYGVDVSVFCVFDFF